MAFADTESESTSIIRYIKNSYTSGAYMFEEDGVLRYGIPLNADEKEYQWEFIEHNGNYEIKNVATGHSITSRAEGSKNVREISDFTLRDLWRIDVTLPCDEFQIFKIAENEDMALHIIEATDGNVICGALGAQNSYGEARWGLFEASEISFAGVIRDGFCISDGSNRYLTADGLVFSQPTGPDDYYIWDLKLQSDGTKTLYNVGKKQYLAVMGAQVELVGEAQATHFTTHATSKVTIVGDNNAVLTRSGSSLSVGSDATSSSATFNVVLASAVGTVLGDLKLDGIYTFSNSWFNMYMLNDGGVPTYGNSAPNNTQIQWEVDYDEKSTYSAIKNVGSNDWLVYDEATKTLSFSKNQNYCWKVLRNLNDLYPEAIRFRYLSSKIFLHMENLTGRLECDSSVQETWGSPHWEAIKYDSASTASMEPTTVETNKWFRLKSAFSNGLYFYQTNGGYAYNNTVAENDARSHWQFIKDGNDYLLYNRNFELYVGSFGNGYLSKTEDKSSATRFGINKYLSDGTYLIYEKNAKDYLSEYINIKNRDSMIHLSLVSVDIKETRWILEEAPEEIATNEIVVSNTVLPTFDEGAKYSLNGTTGLSVEHYANYVRVQNSKGQYLTLTSKGKPSWKKFTHDYDTRFYFSYQSVGDDLLLTRGDFAITLKQVATNRKFMFNEGFVVGNSSTISVYAAEAKEYTVRPHTMMEGVRNDVYVDGVFATSFTSGEVGSIKLSLHKGNNLIKFTRADAVDNVTIQNIISNAYQGATTGTTAYELENYKTNANVEVDARTRWSMTAEASGRSFVLLESVTEYVELTLVNAANAFVLRYSVPDTANGSGKSYSLSMYINGKEKGNLTLTSEYSHLYGTWDYTNNPEDGYHHVYFDEVTYTFDEVQPAGTVLRFRRDFDDEASYYALDLLETEIIPEKVEQPANSLSLADYRSGRSDYDALVACINEAARQGKEVYIPAGVYEMGKKNSSAGRYNQNVSSLAYANNTLNLNKNNVTIRGAGYWYTEIHGLQFEVNANNLSVYSLKLMGYANTRNDVGERACFDGGSNHTGLTLANLWIVHYKVGAWLTDKCQTLISGNRIRYTYADGVNFQAGDKTGAVNCVVENNSVRSTGDDGLAAWSEKNSDKDLIYRYNTVENPWHANCIVLYGGGDISIYNNICKDTAYRGAGVNISTDFEPVNFNGKIIVENNLIIRCGGDNEDSNKKIGGIWFNMLTGYDSFAKMYVRNNVIVNSTYQGISFEQTSIITSLELQENVIVNSGSYGIEFSSDMQGHVFVRNNSISGSALEDVLDNHRDDNAKIVTVDDEVKIDTQNAGSPIALWVVAGVLLAGACAVGALLLVSLLKKPKKEDE